MQCLFQNILCLMFLSVALSLAILRLPSIVHAYLTILWTCRQCTLRVMPVILNGISRYFDHLPVSPGPPLVSLFRHTQRFLTRDWKDFHHHLDQGLRNFFCKGPDSNCCRPSGPHTVSNTFFFAVTVYSFICFITLGKHKNKS